jgi:hypothetical protein
VSLTPQNALQSVFACMAMPRAFRHSRDHNLSNELLIIAPVSEALAAVNRGRTRPDIPLNASTFKAAVGSPT